MIGVDKQAIKDRLKEIDKEIGPESKAAEPKDKGKSQDKGKGQQKDKKK